MTEKKTMYYRVTAKDLRTGQETEVVMPTTSQACWAGLTLRHMSDHLRVHSLEWHYEDNDGTIKSSDVELRAMIRHFFPEEHRFGMEIEFLGDSPIHEGRKIVRFSNMGGYPRNLFMNKMFCIRNLNRYHESYKVFKRLIHVGVPFNYACSIGATTELLMDFAGKTRYAFRGYARTLDPSRSSLQDLKDAAENIHSGVLGNVWGDNLPSGRGGYNREEFAGVDNAVRSNHHYDQPRVNHERLGNGWDMLMKVSHRLTGNEEFLTIPEPTNEDMQEVEVTDPLEKLLKPFKLQYVVK